MDIDHAIQFHKCISCLKIGLVKCSDCNYYSCNNCNIQCKSCKKNICYHCCDDCSSCGDYFCVDCKPYDICDCEQCTNLHAHNYHVKYTSLLKVNPNIRNMIAKKLNVSQYVILLKNGILNNYDILLQLIKLCNICNKTHLTKCGKCDNNICKYCINKKCMICKEYLCLKCAATCSRCDKITCKLCSIQCDKCNKITCKICSTQCDKCNKYLCNYACCSISDLCLRCSRYAR